MGIYDDTPEMRSLYQEIETNGYNPDTDAQQGFLEGFKSSYEQTFKQQTSTGRNDLYTKKYLEQADLYKKNGINITPPQMQSRSVFIGRGIPVDNASFDWEKTIKDNEQLILQLQKEKPELGLKTYSQIDQEVLEEQIQLKNKSEKVQSQLNGLGKAGSIVGSISGFMRDPVNLITLPFGGNVKAGATIAANALRVGTLEAGLATVLDASQKSGEVELRERMGEDVSALDIAAELGLTAATTFAVGGVLGGIGGALANREIANVLPEKGTIDNEVTQKTADIVARFEQKISSGEYSPSQQELDSFNSLKEIVEIAEETPVGLNQTQHFMAYGKAREDLYNGDLVDLSDIIPSAKKPDVEVNPITPEESLYKTSTVESDQELFVQNIRSQLETEDIDIPDFDIEGNEISRSAKEVFQEIDSDMNALKEIETCLMKGTTNGVN